MKMVKIRTPKRYGLPVNGLPVNGLPESGIDISTARLVPGTGTDGWLARLPGAVVWVPGSGHDAEELISACLTASSPTELLGRVGARLADPEAAPWPPFAIAASRGPELVAVVHGPVELVEDQDGEERRLFGGEDVGSWLNRLLRGVQALRAGQAGDNEGLADLREGVIEPVASCCCRLAVELRRGPLRCRQLRYRQLRYRQLRYRRVRLPRSRLQWPAGRPRRPSAQLSGPRRRSSMPIARR